ncbi:hypothetical protein ACDX31_27165, partial [Klebsiella quasipneumoniae]|uniref:hypothetical protein n=1 Tax=Klebsiella quasipneumoniae TaxID=1463165 RepID=UPI0035576CF0
MKSELKIVKDQMPNKKCFKSDETSEQDKLILADMKKQMQVVQAQLQQLKEEEERSSNKFSFRDYFPSYDVASKTSQNNLQTPKESKNIFEEKPLEPKPKRDEIRVRDYTLKKDTYHETKSSNGLNVTLISSNMTSPSKVSKLSSIPPPNKELATPLVD